MALRVEDLRDNVERLLAKVNDETHERLGLPKVEVLGTRHHLPKPDHPLETRRHIGDTARSSARARTSRYVASGARSTRASFHSDCPWPSTLRCCTFAHALWVAHCLCVYPGQVERPAPYVPESCLDAAQAGTHPHGTQGGGGARD